MTTISPYVDVASATVSSGSPNLTANSVNLTASNLRVGDKIFKTDGTPVGFISVVGAFSGGNTPITLYANSPVTLSAVPIRIERMPDTDRVLDAQINYYNALISNIIASLGTLTGTANTVPGFDNSTNPAMFSVTVFARTLLDDTSLNAFLTTMFAKGADIASATTTDIGAATGFYVNVTGTVTITGLGTVAAGVVRLVRFTGALILTHNGTSLVLPGAANITTAAGDFALLVSEGSGNWRCAQYFRAGGLTYYVGGTDIAVADGGTGASTAGAAATNLGLGTGDSPQFTAVNVGHASDTTLTRTGAGDIAVEGNALYRAGGTDVPVADGGTGSSTAAAARTALFGVSTTVDNTVARYDSTAGALQGSGVVIDDSDTVVLSTSTNVTTAPPLTFSGDLNTGIGHSAADTLDFTTGGVDRVQITSGGVLNVITGQVGFPATANSSAGANVLDEYEEGTFTPTMTFGGAAVGMTFSANTGIYVKIGILVQIQGILTLSAKGSSTGSAVMAGNPFSATNGSNTSSARISAASSFTGLTGTLLGQVNGGNTIISLTQWGSTGTAVIADTVFGNTTNFRFDSIYYAIA